MANHPASTLSDLHKLLSSAIYSAIDGDTLRTFFSDELIATAQDLKWISAKQRDPQYIDGKHFISHVELKKWKVPSYVTRFFR